MLESRLQSRQSKRKHRRNRAKALLWKNKRLILLIAFSSFGWFIWHNQDSWFSQSGQQQEQIHKSSSLVTLRSLSPNQRAEQLKQLASTQAVSRHLSPENLQDRNRARYLLASDLIQQDQGKLALIYLQGLGQDYPVLRPQILFKTAQAYQQTNQEAAQETLRYLIKTYPRSPLTANALSLLNEPQSQLESRLINNFPYHPLSEKICSSTFTSKS
jgi:soluble lytic murein transglycosylase